MFKLFLTKEVIYAKDLINCEQALTAVRPSALRLRCAER